MDAVAPDESNLTIAESPIRKSRHAVLRSKVVTQAVDDLGKASSESGVPKAPLRLRKRKSLRPLSSCRIAEQEHALKVGGPVQKKPYVSQQS